MPTEVNYHEHIYPNFANCNVDAFNDADQGHRLTELIFYYAKDTELCTGSVGPAIVDKSRSSFCKGMGRWISTQHGVDVIV
ncbi:hypothetical protein Tcan_16299 [Toxocara canis]|uniref:Uncharacterized protein n=1 Tax=Toxocara canis TaxID=6265 RepID=A0A0B2UWH5_TOXCA|nr:hypothetical protein Tcan_16299 [Toxocara canis]